MHETPLHQTDLETSLVLNGGLLSVKTSDIVPSIRVISSNKPIKVGVLSDLTS